MCKNFLWIILALIISLSVSSKDNISSGVLAGTAIILIWYSWETSALKTEMRRQGDLSERPIINLYLNVKQNAVLQEEWFSLRNVGSISAYNIEIEPIKLGNFEYVFHFKDANYVLEPIKEGRQLKFLTKIENGITAHDMANFKRHFSPESLRLDELDQAKRSFAPFIIHYKNLFNKQFYSVFKFYSKHPLTEEFTIDLVDSGAGIISKDKAVELCSKNQNRETIYG